MKMIAKFSRKGAACYMSHLDLLRCVQRTLRRANMPLAYSQGFNPHPILSFAQAMGVGLATIGDYFEVGLEENLEPEAFAAAFNACATPGVHVIQARQAEEKEKTIMSQVEAATYRFQLEKQLQTAMKDALIKLMAAPEYLFEKKSKSGVKQENMRLRILQAEFQDVSIEAQLSCGNDNLQPKAFWQALCDLSGVQSQPQILRIELWRKEKDAFTPLSQSPFLV